MAGSSGQIHNGNNGHSQDHYAAQHRLQTIEGFISDKQKRLKNEQADFERELARLQEEFELKKFGIAKKIWGIPAKLASRSLGEGNWDAERGRLRFEISRITNAHEATVAKLEMDSNARKSMIERLWSEPLPAYR
jgi:hypothetical protein